MTIYSALRKWMDSPEPGPASRTPSRGAKTEADLRADAETILRGAIDAVEPGRLVADALRSNGAAVPPGGRVRIAGFGVAAAAMARGAQSVLGNRVAGGVLLVPAGEESDAPPQFDTFGGGIPIPDQAGVAGARAIRQMARELTESDTLLALVSGGGAPLLTVPPDGLPLEEIQELIRLLLGADAPECDIDRVHRQVDRVKAGRLAGEAAPSNVVALLLSDIVGDAPDLVASGPFAPDRSRASDAVAALKRHGVWDETPQAVRDHLDRALSGELPPPPGLGDPCFERVTHLVVGNGRTAARAACEAAERLGYEAQLLTDELTGEASKAGEFLAATGRSLSRARGEGAQPLCVVTAGGTRATPSGSVRNGPNQELVLGAAAEIVTLSPVLVASMDTRGFDVHGGAAGAIATGSTARRAREAGAYCREAFERREASRLFEALDDLIVSGPTGTDVGDIQLLLLA